MPQVVPDWVWVVMTIRQEADNESSQGKQAVAEVIRNRMRTHYHSDGTVIGTILRPFQFSGWNTTDPNRIRIAKMDDTDPNTLAALDAYNKAFKMETNLVSGANLYHTLMMNPFPEWSRKDTVKKINIIGRHIFYKDES